MPTLSKMHDKCEKCKEKDTCNNKRMVACAYIEAPQNAITINVSLGESAAQTLLRDTSIQAKIEEQLKKNFYKRCNFVGGM